MEILRTEQVRKVYGKEENQVVAVDNVSFSVEKGEFVAIVGSSGSGKSTLMHMLGGVDRPTGGKVFIEGEDIYQLNDDKLAIFRRRQVGLIYQFFNLVPVLNVEENMTLPVELDGKKPDIEFLNELTETLGLQKRLNHLPNELSGGQQQRVAIGRALMNRPAILLADEPTGNLDSKASAEIMELLKVFNRKYKQTLIMITHDLELAKQADRVLNMEDGRLQEIHCWNEGSRKTPVMEVTQKNPISVAADDEQESR
ncbi:aBC transporter related protein [Clostridium sp. CAG:632]|nr:aBC transporter related protein [Clostridium sp. CAG:632]